MAVRAPHDALGDLRQDPLERVLASREVHDARRLDADVVEIQQRQLSFTAVDAPGGHHDAVGVQA